MNDLSFHESPDKSQISYFLLCNYIDLFIPVAIPESDGLFNHAQSLQLAGDKGHTIWPGIWQILLFLAASRSQIECPLFADYHYSAIKFKLFVCIQLFHASKMFYWLVFTSHLWILNSYCITTIIIFNLINLLTKN